MTRKRFTGYSTNGGRTMSKLLAVVERNDGRPVAWRCHPVAGDAFGPVGGLCLPLVGGVPRLLDDRSLVRPILAAPARPQRHVRRGGVRQFAPCRAPAPSAVCPIAETIPMGVESGLFSPRLSVAGDPRGRRWRNSGLVPTVLLLVGLGRLSGREALGDGDPRIAASARRHPIGTHPRRRRAQAPQARKPCSTKCASQGPPAARQIVTSSPACSRAPMLWSMDARPRLSAWLRRKRAPAASQ